MKDAMKFPPEFQRTLVECQAGHAGLYRDMLGKGHRISRQFIWAIGNGKKKVPPLQLKRICDTLDVSKMVRRKLNRAAAEDYGFEI